MCKIFLLHIFYTFKFKWIIKMNNRKIKLSRLSRVRQNKTCPQVIIFFCVLLGGSWRFICIEKTKLKNTTLSDMHSIEKLMLIHNLCILNFGLVQVTRILTFYQNKLLSKKSIFSRSTQYFQINQNLSCREFYVYHFKYSNFKKRFKIRF